MSSSILIVDDSLENLTVLTKLLSQEGYQVRPAINGHVALRAIEKNQPDLVLLDIMMPDMSGYEVCEHVKADEQTRHIPIIFISARDEVLDKIKAFNLGAIDYIVKPFEPKEVLVRVRTHLMLQTLQRHLQEESERFRRLSEATFEGVLIHQNGIIVEANQAMETLHGCPVSELIGQNIFHLFTKESQDTLHEKIGKQSEPYEVFGRHTNGKTLALEIQDKSIQYRGQELQVLALRDITWRKQLEVENLSLKASLDIRDHFGNLVGKSISMQKVYDRMTKAAASHETIIIYGETGTGKELVAQSIFKLSDRYDKSFIPVNCSAIPDNLFEPQFFGYKKGAFTGAERDTAGYFEKAEGGTLFLDEVGELSLLMQAKMLRVLQNGEYTPVGSTTSRKADVRIIAATNQELRKLKDEGKIREDFFQRLHVIALDLPALRWHKEDIPLLVTHFLTQYVSPGSPLPQIPPDILKQFYAYDWPGNVRELFNELRRYLTMGDLDVALNPTILSETGTLEIETQGRTFQDMVENLEKRLIADALRQHHGNKSQVAEDLQIPLRSLHRKIKKYIL